ncbi:MAG: DUF2652 domain-containing protein [Anaerolineales bacterium]
MAEHGYIVIADITGYTAFLSSSELEHAEDSLRSLINLLIEQTKPPLVISRLQGDAVISYAPKASFLQGQTMVEILENTYVAFRQARERMQLNTTCTCAACRNIPNLDLKFLVHYGSYILQQTPMYQELVGNDVNLTHRLLKNQITKLTGIQAYAAYSEPAVEALGIRDLCVEMSQHTEGYEHLGEVLLYVQDLQRVWERERERRQVFVEPADAWFTLVSEIPAPAPLVWDYFTKPEYRAIMMEADSMPMDNRIQGRTAAGTIYYCAHGDARIRQAVLDWRPFDYYTFETEMPMGTTALISVRFIEVEGGQATRVLGICGKPEGNLLGRGVLTMSRSNVRKDIQRGLVALRETILHELESGAAVRPQAIHVPEEQVAAAVNASVAGSLET